MSVPIFRRFLQWVRTPRHCVGRDFDGNRYFEFPNPNDGRTKRVVKYREGYDMWTYIAGKKRLPVQWSSWLTHTRPHPPTLEELSADLRRQETVRLRAALIEARDREEREAMRVAASDLSSPMVREHEASAALQPPSIPVTPLDHRASGPVSSLFIPTERPAPPPRPDARPSQSSDEPQPWSPRSIQRG